MMGRPDTLDRVAQLLIALVAVFALFDGGFMLADPFGWYQTVGTVKFTGPPNQHFIRDIGLAFVASGLLLAYAATNPRGRWLAALAGSLWLAMHGVLHVWEVLTGICAPDIFWRDAPGVLGPPLIVWLAVGILLGRRRTAPAGLPKFAILREVERTMPDELPVMRDVATAPGHAFEKFTHFMPATMHRYAASADMFHMARIGAVLIEDCGPCALTAAHAALDDGVDRDVVNAALAADPPAGDLQTAFVFGAAIAQQLPEAATLGDQLEQDHGRDVRFELALTAAATRTYAALKRGLGHNQACSITRLEV